eukprot:CAMPEP_0202728902 /NCGR_PEP_ID=MMETSP1385-20130828/185860_1 /ASSEMBLY_ACC=CAM_ASM_000861 /TAXON_ID=933848 /ORGANISM="Elphidium margaritaceum" /LENGTH=498 /DNA_ID=CAMNT_0049395155 /DNA_START=334 /DNA_END=1829 /DNA_ORIENTATION=+
MTAFSDPGIIPRGILPPSSASSYHGPAHLRQRLCISGQLIDIKWCNTCKVFRPPRSFHCYICNNCIERFDHHCPWIGNCIGVRNYAYFSLFVNSLQLMCLWVLAHCIYILVLRAHGEDAASTHVGWHRFVYALKYEWCAFLTAIYVFIAMWFVIGLAVFHWFLVAVGKTTNEQLRNLFPAGSPFKRSLLGNMIDMCCKLPKSALHLHHLSPSASCHEMYVNKHKVILLDKTQAQRHNEQTHFVHISTENSPFKACLLHDREFGYHRDRNQNGNGMRMVDREQNGVKNGYSHAHSIATDIQMTMPSSYAACACAAMPSSHAHAHAQQHIAIEEEEEEKAAIENNQEHRNEHCDDEVKVEEKEEEEEQKYENETENEHVHKKHRRQFSNMDHSISASRNDDDGQEAEMLYPSGDDAADLYEDEEEKMNITPDGSETNNTAQHDDERAYNIISTTPPPHNTDTEYNLSLSRSRPKYTSKPASKILLAAESPQPDVDEETSY